MIERCRACPLFTVPVSPKNSVAPQHTESAPLFHPALDGAAVFFRLFAVVDADEQNVSVIVRKVRGVPFFLDPADGGVCGFVPIQLHDESRLLRKGGTRKKDDIGESLAGGKLAEKRILLPCREECDIDATRQRVFVIVSAIWT